MPKAFGKIKHGQKATVQEQSCPVPGNSATKHAQGGDPSTRVPGSKDSYHHHKSHKHSTAALRVEKHWDKVLHKLCDKASGHHDLLPVGSADIVISDMAAHDPMITPD